MNSTMYYQIVGKRIKKAMEAKNITQTELRDKCSDQGLVISQPSLSRMLNGLDKLDTYRIVTICKILSLKLDDVLSFDSEDTVSTKEGQSNPSFITDASDRKFKCYIETYYGYFYSTENNDTIHEGIFKFYPDNKTTLENYFENNKNPIVAIAHNDIIG